MLWTGCWRLLAFEQTGVVNMLRQCSDNNALFLHASCPVMSISSRVLPAPKRHQSQSLEQTGELSSLIDQCFDQKNALAAFFVQQAALPLENRHVPILNRIGGLREKPYASQLVLGA